MAWWLASAEKAAENGLGVPTKTPKGRLDAVSQSRAKDSGKRTEMSGAPSGEKTVASTSPVCSVGKVEKFVVSKSQKIGAKCSPPPLTKDFPSGAKAAAEV